MLSHQFYFADQIIYKCKSSIIGLGGILIQVVDGKEKIVAYYSRQTFPTEQKLHSFELETLAILAAVTVRIRKKILGNRGRSWC